MKDGRRNVNPSEVKGFSNAERAKAIRSVPNPAANIGIMAGRACKTLDAVEGSLGFYAMARGGWCFGWKMLDGWYIVVFPEHFRKRGRHSFAIGASQVERFDAVRTAAYMRDGDCALGRHEWVVFDDDKRQCSHCSRLQRLVETERVVIDRDWVDVVTGEG